MNAKELIQKYIKKTDIVFTETEQNLQAEINKINSIIMKLSKKNYTKSEILRIELAAKNLQNIIENIKSKF